jgi:glycosyl transferase family 87
MAGLFIEEAKPSVAPGRGVLMQRGRATVALFLSGYFGLLLALGGYHSWRRLGVPYAKHYNPRAHPVFPAFWDLTSAWDCTRRGIAVLPRNPCGGGSANWPQLWLWPWHLGLGGGDTVPLAITVLVVFFVVAVLVVPPDAGAWAGGVYGLALCSPAVMFGPDYGDIDIVIFSLVAGGAMLFRRRLSGLLVGQGLLFLAALLKLFPVVAAAALLRQRRRAAQIGGALIVVGFLIYFLADYAYLTQALRATSQADSASYGMRLFTEWFILGVNTVSPRVAAGVNQHLTERAWDVGIAAVIALTLLTFRTRLRSHLSTPAPPKEGRDLDLFWVGASIYVCSYVVFRSWDYRLAFALLTIPQLLRWVATRKAVAIVTLLALFGTLWLDLTPPSLISFRNTVFSPWNHLTRTFPFTEPLSPAVFAQLIFFAGLLAAMVATLPSDWFRHFRRLTRSSSRSG